MNILESIQFLGLDCVQLKNNAVSLLVTRSVGPRIISLRLANGENLFAELPDLTLAYPNGGELRFWGGHRLWHAPEVPARTYIPDDDSVEITAVANGLHVVQPTETQTGIQKSLHIHLPDDSATVVVDHTLTNEGSRPVECAPWAITQMKTGGVAILPQVVGAVEPTGTWPNRSIVLWPYTDINSQHIQWGDRFVFVKAMMQSGTLKLGYPNPLGWLAYYWNHTLFVKRASFQSHETYFDFGASSQCYCNPSFLELETMGPRTVIAPGESVTHQEMWELYDDVTFAPNEDDAQVLVDQLITKPDNE
jgi:hypothetical protein